MSEQKHDSERGAMRILGESESWLVKVQRPRQPWESTDPVTGTETVADRDPDRVQIGYSDRSKISKISKPPSEISKILIRSRCLIPIPIQID
eukprot:8780281-Pyramimonas_sp.AAC.1